MSRVNRARDHSPRSNRDRVIEGLRRYHVEPDSLFDAWSTVWLSEEFRDWDVRPILSAIDRPTAVIQSALDEYASSAHATSTAAAIGLHASCRILPGLGHLLHREDPEQVATLLAGFVNSRGVG